MKLTMLGTGHAMVTECYNTCFLLSDDDAHLLVDGGGGNGVLRQLKCAGVHPVDLHEVFVTHRHLDHLMGVMWLVRTWTQLMLRGVMQGEVRVYAHDEVCTILATMAGMLLNDREATLIGERIRLVEVHDREPIRVLGCELIPFDIHSTKAKQFGFRLCLEGGRWLTCCGDEPLPPELFELACQSDWLLHEAFCLQSELDAVSLARMHHSSVFDAAATAQKVSARNLVLYHSRDDDLQRRQKLFIAEGSKAFDGAIFAPYDLEVIDLA